MAVILAYLACALTWGTTWYAIRLCIAPGGYPPLWGAVLRFCLASVLLVGFWLLVMRPRPKLPSRRPLLWLCAAGALNAVNYGLIYVAEQHIPGSIGAVLFATFPLVTGILSTVTRTEIAKPGDFAGALIALGGVALIFLDRRAVSQAQALGVVLVMPAVVLSACYAVILKRFAAGVHTVVSTTVFLTMTSLGLLLALPFAPMAPVFPVAVVPTLALLYLALAGSILTFGCYLYLLRHASLMTVATLAVVPPLVAVGIDALFEHQIRLDGRSYAGMGIALGGVCIPMWLRMRNGFRNRKPCAIDAQ